MAEYCCFSNCKNVWDPSKNITFHRFPLNQPEILKLWIQALDRKDYAATSDSRICSDHFTKDDFLNHGVSSMFLKNGAVPNNSQDLNPTETTSRNSNETVDNKPYLLKEILQRATSKSTIKVIHDKQKSVKPTTPKKILSHVSTQTSMRLLKSDKNRQQKEEYTRKIAVLQKRLKRRTATLGKAQELIKELKVPNKVKKIEETLVEHFEGFPLEICKNLFINASAKGPAKRYSNDIKKFAMIIYSISPKAYEFIREKLCLPNASLLRKWIASVKITDAADDTIEIDTSTIPADENSEMAISNEDNDTKSISSFSDEPIEFDESEIEVSTTEEIESELPTEIIEVKWET